MLVIFIFAAIIFFAAYRVFYVLDKSKSVVRYRIRDSDAYQKRFEDDTDDLIKDGIISVDFVHSPYRRFIIPSFVLGVASVLASLLFCLTSCTSTRTITHNYDFFADTVHYKFQYTNTENYTTKKDK